MNTAASQSLSLLARGAFALVLGLATLAAAAGLVRADEKDQPKASDKLAPHKCGQVQRLHVLGGVYLASQPQAEDFRLLHKAGVKTVINLRQADEFDWDEAGHVKQLGMTYVHLPFRAPSTLTDEVFDKARTLLKDKKQQPLVLHCASANRVGAIWLAHRMLDGGLGYDAALAEAKMVGLSLPAYVEKAQDYVRRRQK